METQQTINVQNTNGQNSFVNMSHSGSVGALIKISSLADVLLRVKPVRAEMLTMCLN